MMDRTELMCSRCGKVRVLSVTEAEEDGWEASTEGLICPQCIPSFGIPLNGPPHPTKENEIEAQRLRRFAEKIVYKYDT